MNRVVKYLTGIFFMVATIHGWAQTNEQIYQQQKAAGQVPDGSLLTPMEPDRDAKPPASSGERSACDCYQAPDASYTLAMGPNDDGSTAAIAIPFNFCLYGTNYTQFYINNNGNITFDNPYSTFSAVGFPSPSYVMVAPFWGDVDTRSGLGQVYYKVTPNAVYVNWVDVGYYNQHGDKLNTFQVIFTDGTSPDVPNGNNVAFCYQEMEWTTGDASGGSGGFGGTPATVGVNKGNGVDYIQMGRFDQPGTAYDGPFGNSDGVDWLDYQSLYFDVCNTTNIPPIFDDLGLGATGSSTSGACATDTFRICGDGDTLILSPSFLAPESGQTVTVTANFNGMPNASVINSNPGNPGTADIMIIGSSANAGYNTIDIIGTDDGSPIGTTTIPVVIHVDTTTLSNLNPIISGDTVACNNTTLALDSAWTYDYYQWSEQPSDSTIFIDTSGTYYVTVERQNCFKSEFIDVIVVEDPIPAIDGYLFACPNDSTLLGIDTAASVGNPYDSLDWGSGLDTTSTYWATPGNYSLTVVDTNGCTASISYTVSSSTPLSMVDNVIEICDTLAYEFLPGQYTGEDGGTWVVLDSTPGSTSTFTPPDAVAPIFQVDTGGYYEYEYTDLCGDIDTVRLLFTARPNPQLSDLPVCSSPFTATELDPQVVDFSGDMVYQWSTGDTTETIMVTDTGQYYVDVSNSCGNASDTANVFLAWLTVPQDVSVCGTSYDIPPSDISSVAGGSWSYSGPGNLNFVPNANTEDPIVTASTEGTYTLTFEENICGYTGSFEITFVDSVDISVSGDTICDDEDITLSVSSQSGTQYLWSTGATSSSITVADSGWYVITASNICNTDQDSAYVTVIPCECNIPNVITPNGDDKNQTLFIDCIKYFPENKLEIFNRWGTKVWEMEGYDQSWAGTNQRGTALSDGTYYYVLTIPKTGDVWKGPVTVFHE